MTLNPRYPVFANTRPWNELILRGVRKFKTISFPWKYRGTIYLYDTKGKADYDFAPDWAKDHGVEISPEFGFPGCIVGTVEVYDSRRVPGDRIGRRFRGDAPKPATHRSRAVLSGRVGDGLRK